MVWAVDVGWDGVSVKRVSTVPYRHFSPAQIDTHLFGVLVHDTDT